MRGLLEPVTDDQTDSQNANPLVICWNLLGVPRTIEKTIAPKYLVATLLATSAAIFALQLYNFSALDDGESPSSPSTAIDNASIKSWKSNFERTA